MAVCKYCHGYGCTNQCIEEKQKSKTMKPLKGQLVFGNESIEDMQKISRIVVANGHWQTERNS